MSNTSSSRFGRWFGPSRRIGTVMTALLAMSILFVSVAFAAAADIDQCRNGSLASPVPCTGSAWVNGNAGASNSHWREGDSLPYRMKLTSVGAGTWTLTIGWDVTHGGAHAIDYLTTYNRTDAAADPCSSVGCSLSNFDTFPIPTDPAYTGCPLSGTQVPGLFYIFGATGTTVDIVSVSSYLLTGCVNPASDVENRISIRFTSTDPSPVIAWGGHVATSADWGQGLAAGGISGSPYHMRLKGFCTGVQDNTCADGGNQDRSLAAAAVGAVTITTQRSPSGAIAPGGNVTDTASLTGSISGQAPTGSVQFYTCRKVTNSPTDYPVCNSAADGTALGSPVTVVTSSNTGTATSPTFSTSAVGTYCFLAVYTSTSAAYNGAVDQINAGNQVAECFSIQGPTAVKIDSFGAQPGNDMLSMSGTLALGLAAIGVTMLGMLAFVIARKR